MSDALQFDDGLNAKWRDAVALHKLHAEHSFPNEAVGVVDQDGVYHACDNIATDPVDDFEISDAQYNAACGRKPAALLHSHTASPHPVTGATRPPLDSPTEADMIAQASMGVPWGITMAVEGGVSDPFWFGAQVERPPLYGRVFRHGVNDCYSFIRDWYKQVADIALPEFPRGVDWWEAGEEGEKPKDLYLDGFTQAGFLRVDRPYNPLPGDVFLCRVKSAVINHGGVYIGNGLIGHHLLWQLSLRQPASIWRPKLDFLVRHKDLPDDWEPEDV